MTAFTGTNLPGKRENFQTKRPFLSLCLVVLVEFLGLFVLGDKFRSSFLRNLVTANKWSRLVFRILSLEAMTDDDVPKIVPWRNLTKHRPSPCLFRTTSKWPVSRVALNIFPRKTLAAVRTASSKREAKLGPTTQNVGGKFRSVFSRSGWYILLHPTGF